MKLLRIALPFAAFLSATCPAATWYVSPSGNDLNTGTVDAPWRTIASVEAGFGPQAAVFGGDTVLLANGTYQENDGGRFILRRAFTDFVTYAPALGAAGNVTIQGASDTTSDVSAEPYSLASFRRFSHINFRMRPEARSILCFDLATSATHDLEFDDCHFTNLLKANQYLSSVLLYANTDPVVGSPTNVSFNRCTCDDANPDGIPVSYGLDSSFLVASKVPGNPFKNFSIDHCTITMLGGAGNAENTDGFKLTNSTIHGNGYFTAVAIGPDSVAIQPNFQTNFLISGNKITCDLGHAILVGGGSNGGVVSQNTITANGNQGIVIKESQNVSVTGNVVDGRGSPSLINALYNKGSQGCTYTGNTLIVGGASTSDASAFAVHEGDTGNLSGTLTFTGNRLVAMETSSSSTTCHLITWSYLKPAEDSGGSVCDHNIYELRHSGGPSPYFGTVLSRVLGPGCSLSLIRSAWAGYNVTGNDLHSTLIGH